MQSNVGIDVAKDVPVSPPSAGTRASFSTRRSKTISLRLRR